MKTIEERADEYARGLCAPDCALCNDICIKATSYRPFMDGAQSEHEELTRWHDPKEELPDDDRDVLVKTTMCRKYCIAFYKSRGPRNYRWHENNGSLDDDMVIGWREIHE